MPKMMTSVLLALGAIEDASADRGKGNHLIVYPPQHRLGLGRLRVG